MTWHRVAGGSAEERLRKRLVRWLQLAYSGELGAALGYAGHAHSVSDAREREKIHSIRMEELEHRRRVGFLLARLGAGPDPLLELRNRCVGGSIAAFCQVGGWFLPMYGAGWIEVRNLEEYERAARLSARCGERAMARQLLELAEVEWEHELYFRSRAASHPCARLLKVWRAPGPKADIQQRFDQFVHALDLAVRPVEPFAQVPLAMARGTAA